MDLKKYTSLTALTCQIEEIPKARSCGDSFADTTIGTKQLNTNLGNIGSFLIPTVNHPNILRFTLDRLCNVCSSFWDVI